MLRSIRNFFIRIGRIFILTSSFLMIEIVEILRQPRLILTLVLGPFLILLLFGLGYRNQARPLRTMFVVPDSNPALRQQVEQYAKDLGSQLIYAGITSDENLARTKLHDGQVDVVVVPPPDVQDELNNNQQAVIKLYHNEIDPVQADYVAVFGRIYTDEMNRRVLETMTRQGQTEFSGVGADLAAARASLAAIRAASQAGDQATAQREAGKLDTNLSNLEVVAATGIGLLAGAGDGAGSQQNADAQETARLLAEMRKDNQSVSAGKADAATNDRLDRDMGLIEGRMKQFENVDPNVLVSPFRSETESVASVEVNITDFYAPAVIVLLLQHLCITFAALSVVRDRRSGAMELFRVSPLAAAEMLVGKYLSYFLFAGILSAILTAILVYVLKVPMLDWWQNYGLAVAVLIFTSLGAGFVISLASNTTTQAVQYAMLLLLASVFFTGFFLRLDNLLAPVRLISWLLPATYGIQLLQNIMLRGRGIDVPMISALAAIGVFLMIVAWTQLRKVMAYE